MLVRLFLIPAFVFVALGFSTIADADKVTLKRITRNMICVCGSCSHLVDDCGDECGMAPRMSADIQAKLDSGMTEQEIFAVYEKELGLKIHAAPKAEGFYLLAWILPFVALTCGGVLVAVFLKTRKEPDPGPKTRRRRSLSAKHRKMLDRELAE